MNQTVALNPAGHLDCAADRVRAYRKARAAPTATVNGKGGGARHAITKASVACFAISALRYSTRLRFINSFILLAAPPAHQFQEKNADS